MASLVLLPQELASTGSTLSKVKNDICNLVDNVIQTGKVVNDNLVQPLQQAFNDAKDSVDILKQGVETIQNIVADSISATDTEGKANATRKFDDNWDKFAKEFDEKFNRSSSEVQKNILESFARDRFGDNIFVAGSIIKNETPIILEGIVSIEKSIEGIKIDTHDPIGTAKSIKDRTAEILRAVQSIDNSAATVFNRVTSELGINASALINLQNGLHKIISDTKNDLPQSLKDALSRTSDGVEVLNSAKILVSVIVNDIQGEITPAKLSKITTDINASWDNFAKNTNALFEKLTDGKQSNILEAFARSNFGDNVFYASSAIKQGMPGIMSGVADFQAAFGSFKGNFHNPFEAATNIKNGVEGIVQATEKIAGSMKKMVRIYSSKGDTSVFRQTPLLDKISQLGDTKMIRSLDSVLKIGVEGTSLVDSTDRMINNLKSGNLKAGVDDAKKVLRHGKSVLDEVKNFGKKRVGVPSKNNLSPKTKDNNDTSQRLSGENGSNGQGGGDSDSYVCSTATMKCPFGDKTSKLTVLPNRTVFLSGEPMANISDHVALLNIAPFGKCSTTSFPPTGAATSANHGVLTPMPCVPGTVSEWKNGKVDYVIKGSPALLKSSYCKCQWGGVITIIDDGQKGGKQVDLTRDEPNNQVSTVAVEKLING